MTISKADCKAMVAMMQQGFETKSVIDPSFGLHLQFHAFRQKITLADLSFNSLVKKWFLRNFHTVISRKGINEKALLARSH